MPHPHLPIIKKPTQPHRYALQSCPLRISPILLFPPPRFLSFIASLSAPLAFSLRHHSPVASPPYPCLLSLFQGIPSSTIFLTNERRVVADGGRLRRQAGGGASRPAEGFRPHRRRRESVTAINLGGAAATVVGGEKERCAPPQQPYYATFMERRRLPQRLLRRLLHRSISTVRSPQIQG